MYANVKNGTYSNSFSNQGKGMKESNARGEFKYDIFDAL
jgi:hypothetical protein